MITRIKPTYLIGTLPFRLRADRMKRLARDIADNDKSDTHDLIKYQKALDTLAQQIGFANYADFSASKGEK